jgi:hypothetical protein
MQLLLSLEWLVDVLCAAITNNRLAEMMEMASGAAAK